MYWSLDEIISVVVRATMFIGGITLMIYMIVAFNIGDNYAVKDMREKASVTQDLNYDDTEKIIEQKNSYSDGTEVFYDIHSLSDDIEVKIGSNIIEEEKLEKFRNNDKETVKEISDMINLSSRYLIARTFDQEGNIIKVQYIAK